MIVEFIEGREFMAAWLIAPAAHRVTVLGQNGREMTVSRKRIINSQDFPDPGDNKARVELLKAADATRRELALTVNLEELWEILEAEGELFTYEVLASLYFGDSPGLDEVSALARAVLNDGLRFRFTPEGAVRHSQDEFEKLIRARQVAQAAEQTLENMLAHLQQGLKAHFLPDCEDTNFLVKILKDLAVLNDKAVDKEKAKVLLQKAGLSPDEKGAIQALKELGVFGPHENIPLLRLNLPLDFTPESLEEARGIAVIFKGGREERQDLTTLNTLTIDSNGARDLDDAVSIKSLAGGRWQLGIHISDVAAFIPPDSNLDLAAQAKASSIYLPDGKYPMLPTELSEGFLSLTSGDVKPAFSFLIILEKNGEVSEYSLMPSHIRVKRQLSFSEADQLLDDDSDLVDLWDLSQALIARRLSSGGVNLSIPKLNVFFMPDGSLNVGLTQWDTPSKIIISELMILANYLAADYMNKKDCPCPYRFQEKAHPYREGRHAPLTLDDGGEGGQDQDALLAGSLAARRRTGRSGLSFLPAAHQGLGLPYYTSFTAPMRRYLDLLTARQLRSLVEGGPPLMDQQNFLRLALPTFELGKDIQKMQGLRQRYWLKKYLSNKVGREFSALVFEQNERRLKVCVTDYMLETDVWLPKGDGGRVQNVLAKRVSLRLSSVGELEEGFKFELV